MVYLRLRIRQFWYLYQIFCLKYCDMICFKRSLQKKFVTISSMLIFFSSSDHILRHLKFITSYLYSYKNMMEESKP